MSGLMNDKKNMSENATTKEPAHPTKTKWYLQELNAHSPECVFPTRSTARNPGDAPELSKGSNETA